MDGAPQVRDSLHSLLASVGHRPRTFASGDEFLLHARPRGPGCVVLEVRLAGICGLELQERLAGEAPELPCIFITEHGDVPMCARAMKSGAVDFLDKPVREQDLLDAVRQALQLSRRRVDDSRTKRDVLERLRLLTPRERQVFGLVVDGLSNRQIGNRLGTTEKTVKVHRGRVMRKLDASSVVELVLLATRCGAAG